MRAEQAQSGDSVRVTPATRLSLVADAPHEEVVEVVSPRSGLHGFIAVHNTRYGPGLGGCRAWVYDSDEEAVGDVLRLSRAMTLKARAAELPLGGGKSVISLRPGQMLTPQLLQDFGRAIDQLGGRYVVAEDVGTSEAAMVEMRKTTEHVTGLPGDRGGKGDPGVFTARSVFLSIAAAWRHLTGNGSLEGVRCAVQGLGHVGNALVGMLDEAGAELWVCDIDAARVAAATERHGAHVVSPDDVLGLDCEVLSPCAMGGVLDAAAIDGLECRAVVGAANNQLADPADAARVRDRGVLYAPDFVANVGGLINVAGEILDFTDADIARQIDAVGPRVEQLLRRANEQSISADELARAEAESAIED